MACFSSLRVFLAIFLLFSCHSDVSGEDEQEHTSHMKAIMDGIQTILERLEEQQIRLHNLEEQLLDCKECATGKDLEDFQNMSLIEFQKTEVSLRDCSTVDQISELQDVMQTDECEDGTHQCHDFATCSDRVVKYQCTCLPGYSGDGFWCQDINECLIQNVSCWGDEICANRPGTFECVCREGFVRRANSCIDSTCRSPSLFMDGLGCITPLFTKMNWDDARTTCEGMGQRLLQDLRAEHVEPLGQHFGLLMDFQPTLWIGLKDLRWISSQKIAPEEIWAEATPDGGCGCLDLRDSKLGVWDGGCDFQDYALCQSL